MCNIIRGILSSTLCATTVWHYHSPRLGAQCDPARCKCDAPTRDRNDGLAHRLSNHYYCGLRFSLRVRRVPGPERVIDKAFEQLGGGDGARRGLVSRPPFHTPVALDDGGAFVLCDARVKILESRGADQFVSVHAQVNIAQELLLHEWRQRT